MRDAHAFTIFIWHTLSDVSAEAESETKSVIGPDDGLSYDA